MTSQVKMHMSGRLVEKRGPVSLAADAKITQQDLANIGVNLSVAMDALAGGGAGGVPGYVSQEVLETWLSGTLRAITQVRNIDAIAGVTTVGSFADEAIKLRMVEASGQAELYGDNANIPLADIRTTIESRNVVLFEQGFSVGKLEDIRLGAAGYQAAEDKRKAAADSLDIARNNIGFNGFHSAATNTYGLLNDPNLSAAVNYTTAWASASFDDLKADFNALIDRLEEQMGGHLSETEELLLAMPTGYRSALAVSDVNTSESFREWLKRNYPNLRITTAPEFKKVNGGADVAYLIAENVDGYDGSDVAGATIIQAVPSRYETLGSENGIKGYLEDAIMATAGCFVLRPWAVVRITIS